MTNSPTYNKQLALNEYWKSIGGLSFLPGTNRPSDRFARASFYVNALPETDDVRIAVASVFSVVRNASVPYGISTPENPEISTTQWRTVSESGKWICQKVLRYLNCLFPTEKLIMVIRAKNSNRRNRLSLWE